MSNLGAGGFEDAVKTSQDRESQDHPAVLVRLVDAAELVGDAPHKVAQLAGLHLIEHLQENNPALSENGAAQFATISAKAYCPRQLDEAEEPGTKSKS